MPRTSSVKTRTKDERAVQTALARSLFGRALGFRDCRPDTLDAMVDAGRMRSLSKGEVLAQRGVPFDMLCLIVEGSIEASLLRHDGHRHLVSFLQPGDVAGMISMLDGMGHVNDLCARSSGAAVLLIPGETIRQLRAVDPAVSHAFEQQLAFRSRMLYERLASDPSMPLELRLARLLQTLSGIYGLPRPEGLLLQMKISQSDLGDWLGVSRQRANFAVQQLRKDGLIELRYSTITITDPARLAEQARL